MGGTYIGMDVGKSKEPASTFKGLEVPPVVTMDVPGSTFYLHAADLGSLSITSPVFFRRLRVGQVVAYDLDKDSRGITFTIFINAPYDQYVRSNTHFWNASGIDFALNTNGLKVKTESLVSILFGGIDFEAPEGKSEEARAAPNSAFTLFADKEDAMLHAETARTFLLIFRESVRGLSVDSPVEYHGVKLGGVTRISLEFDPRSKDGPATNMSIPSSWTLLQVRLMPMTTSWTKFGADLRWHCFCRRPAPAPLRLARQVTTILRSCIVTRSIIPASPTL